MSRILRGGIVFAFAAGFVILVTAASFAEETPPPLAEAEVTFTAPPVAAPAHRPVRAALVPVSNSDWTPMVDQVFTAIGLGLVGWIVRIITPMALRFGDWIGQRAAIEDLLRDERMSALAKMVGDQALNLALGRLGYTRDDLKDLRVRNSVFDYAAKYAHEQWPEVWKWVDQNHNGQIDFFEAVTAHSLPPIELKVSMATDLPEKARSSKG